MTRVSDTGSGRPIIEIPRNLSETTVYRWQWLMYSCAISGCDREDTLLLTDFYYAVFWTDYDKKEAPLVMIIAHKSCDG
jgi:hypothetical protein